jgi:hypothetical protein
MPALGCISNANPALIKLPYCLDKNNDDWKGASPKNEIAGTRGDHVKLEQNFLAEHGSGDHHANEVPLHRKWHLRKSIGKVFMLTI